MLLTTKRKTVKRQVTILILVDGFLQFHKLSVVEIVDQVTILILVDGFLQ